MQWFRRLADVPGVNYLGSPGVNRARLPGHKLVPEISVYEFDGKRRETAMWNHRDGRSSASPAQAWQTTPQAGESLPQTTLRQLHEQLELPGEVSDYHFAIQHCHTQLWSHRQEYPSVLATIEELCWLDIRLLEAYPDTMRRTV